MKSKRVTLVAVHPVGGIRTYFNYVYHDEQQFDYRFDIVCTENSNNVFDGVFKTRLNQVHAKGSMLGIVKGLFNSIRLFKPDLIHSHGLTSALLTSPFALLFGKKHMVTLHDVFLDSHFVGAKGRLKWHVLNVFFKLPITINPCGYDTAANLKQYFPRIPDKKITTIRNGIAAEQFHIEQTRNLKQELALAETTFLIGFMGRFMKQKGFDLLIDAMVKLDDVDIKVACFGWGGFIREEQQRIEQLGLSDRFIFLPHTNEVAKSLRGLDVLVIPSRWEACPLLPMEALMAGVPFIGSDCIGLKEVMNDTPALQFASENVEQLVDCIKRSRAELPSITERFDEFRSEAVDRFSSDKLKQELSTLYRQLMD